jgi:hypothetical protein
MRLHILLGIGVSILLCMGVSANNCSNPIVLPCPTCVTGSTVGQVHDHLYPATCPGAFNGPDVVYSFTISVPSDVTITAESDASWDGDYALYRDDGLGCNNATLIYCVDFDGIWNPSMSCGGLTSHTFGTCNRTFTLSADTYYFWIDGYNSWDEGNYALEISCVQLATQTPTATEIPTETPTVEATADPSPTASVVDIPATSTLGVVICVLIISLLVAGGVMKRQIPNR